METLKETQSESPPMYPICLQGSDSWGGFRVYVLSDRERMAFLCDLEYTVLR